MISICIPTYLQNGHGPKMLTQLLNTIRIQEINYEYEVIISDNDETGAIIKVCDRFYMLPIRYNYNDKKGSSENINNSISLANYDMVKLICMDDMFARKDSINLFVQALQKHKWIISNSVRIRENGLIYSKQNTKYVHRNFVKNITGMPSVIGWHKCDLRFDERFKTIQDMYFYHQLYELYGQPGIINEYTIAQRFWAGSLSHNQLSKHKEEVRFLFENKMI